MTGRYDSQPILYVSCDMASQFGWTLAALYLFGQMAVLVNSCKQEFLDLVKVCHDEVKEGLPRLHSDPLLIVDNFNKMEAYCRLNVSAHITQCMTELYECPAHVQMRKMCNLASLDPEMIVRRLELTCPLVNVIKDEIDCVNQQVCSVKRCLATVARHPDSMNFAILSPPNRGSKCSWLNSVKSCYDLHVRTTCSDSITDYMTSMLDTYKPPSCSELDVISQELSNGSRKHHKLFPLVIVFIVTSLYRV